MVDPPREFPTADTSKAAVRVLGKHPQLRSAGAGALIDRFIRKSGERNDLVVQRPLKERRKLLGS